MPYFDEFFNKSKGKPTQYKGKTIVMGDYYPFEDGDHFLITVEKTNSEWRQGIGLSIFGFIEVEALRQKVKGSVAFWEDKIPKEFSIKVWKDNTKRKQPKRLPKKGLLGIKNIWDTTGQGSVDFWFGGAAMIIEEIEDGRRYWCNDGHPDENFDDIVFTVRKIT